MVSNKTKIVLMFILIVMSGGIIYGFYSLYINTYREAHQVEIVDYGYELDIKKQTSGSFIDYICLPFMYINFEAFDRHYEHVKTKPFRFIIRYDNWTDENPKKCITAIKTEYPLGTDLHYCKIAIKAQHPSCVCRMEENSGKNNGCCSNAEYISIETFIFICIVFIFLASILIIVIIRKNYQSIIFNHFCSDRV